MNEKTSTFISVVDDDKSVVEATVGLMESIGHEAKGFSSAEEFLNSTESRRTGCLILDIHMPGMSGLDLQRQLTSGESRIPIIFITGRCDEEVATQALQAGAVGLLVKPFNQESLLRVLQSALGQQSTGG